MGSIRYPGYVDQIESVDPGQVITAEYVNLIQDAVMNFEKKNPNLWAPSVTVYSPTYNGSLQTPKVWCLVTTQITLTNVPSAIVQKVSVDLSDPKYSIPDWVKENRYFEGNHWLAIALWDSTKPQEGDKTGDWINPQRYVGIRLDDAAGGRITVFANPLVSTQRRRTDTLVVELLFMRS